MVWSNKTAKERLCACACMNIHVYIHRKDETAPQSVSVCVCVCLCVYQHTYIHTCQQGGKWPDPIEKAKAGRAKVADVSATSSSFASEPTSSLTDRLESIYICIYMYMPTILQLGVTHVYQIPNVALNISKYGNLWPLNAIFLASNIIHCCCSVWPLIEIFRVSKIIHGCCNV